MSDQILSLLTQLGAIGALALVGALIFRRSVHWGWLIGALLLYAVYDALLSRLFGAVPSIPGSDWNWSGKFMSTGAMLVVASLPLFGWKASGLTLRQNPGSWPAYLLFVALCGLYAYWALSTGDTGADAETIAFQWTMPGIDEELFYRGVLLLAFNEAFRAKANILGARIGYGGLLTSILFGFAHALFWENGAVDFDPMTFAMTGVPSLLLLYMREKTGSLLLPVIAHNVANGIFHVI